MAMAMRLVQLLVILVFSLATFKGAVIASDPDIISDFIVPPDYNGTVDGTFFTFTGFRASSIKLLKPSRRQRQALLSSQLSMAKACRMECFNFLLTRYYHLTPARTQLDCCFFLMVPWNFHQVGSRVDRHEKQSIYSKLQTGDLFVFPEGLVHYQYNSDPQLPATAIAAFGSASARAVTVLPSVFGTGIDDVILAKSFKTDVGTID